MTEISGGRGTRVLSPASEQDACLLHEDDSDQSMYSCPSPTIDSGDDDLEDSVASSPQVWFDTDTLEACEFDNLDEIGTTVQHSIQEQRSDQMSKLSRQKRSQSTPSPSRVLALRMLRVSSP